MDEQTIQAILDQLRDGELNEYHVSKEQFIEFRNTLVNREDFKHFRGIAQQGGSIIYRYLQEPRS
ncbi:MULTISPECIES: hypothetical protein [Metabacillus]|jgi:hypothetical protein|uniref:Abortive phage infection protein n=1 Tax=Metabacillus rhizolycopersici TaxID=2875709 RepID=A0ABS7UZQ0_9BACI|nr:MULTISPECIES: hypothetical protein [Metabacillus]MBZ5753385.1 hypothetical protein [Metabacillus rhizolycopersici]MCM3652390.1 hypothetical protein [Metabacillus litoralis]